MRMCNMTYVNFDSKCLLRMTYLTLKLYFFVDISKLINFPGKNIDFLLFRF